MGGFKILVVAVCAISALGAIADGKEKQKGFIALFAASGVLFLASAGCLRIRQLPHRRPRPPIYARRNGG